MIRNLTVLLLVGLASAQEAASRPTTTSRATTFDATRSDAAAERFFAKSGLAGAGLALGDRTGALHVKWFGTYGEKTVVPIASASKWLAGSVVMALVDRGKLDLDAPVAKYLPEFAESHPALTVRMLMNHTSGLPKSDAGVHDVRIPMREAARRAAALDPVAAPGVHFEYGGVAMQVAGAVCEVVGGKPWRELFTTLIGDPCKLTATRWGALARAPNPMVAGGAWSSLGDYGRFLTMLARGGELDGVRVLSADAVRTLTEDRTGSAEKGDSSLLRALGARGYGVGCWVDSKRKDGTTIEASSPGAFGFLPWVDLEHGTWGVWMIEEHRIAQGALPALLLAVRVAARADLAALTRDH